MLFRDRSNNLEWCSGVYHILLVLVSVLLMIVPPLNAYNVGPGQQFNSVLVQLLLESNDSCRIIIQSANSMVTLVNYSIPFDVLENVFKITSLVLDKEVILNQVQWSIGTVNQFNPSNQLFNFMFGSSSLWNLSSSTIQFGLSNNSIQYQGGDLEITNSTILLNGNTLINSTNISFIKMGQYIVPSNISFTNSNVSFIDSNVTLSNPNESIKDNVVLSILGSTNFTISGDTQAIDAKNTTIITRHNSRLIIDGGSGGSIQLYNLTMQDHSTLDIINNTPTEYYISLNGITTISTLQSPLQLNNINHIDTLTIHTPILVNFTGTSTLLDNSMIQSIHSNSATIQFSGVSNQVSLKSNIFNNINMILNSNIDYIFQNQILFINSTILFNSFTNSKSNDLATLDFYNSRLVSNQFIDFNTFITNIESMGLLSIYLNENSIIEGNGVIRGIENINLINSFIGSSNKVSNLEIQGRFNSTLNIHLNIYIQTQNSFSFFNFTIMEFNTTMNPKLNIFINCLELINNQENIYHIIQFNNNNNTNNNNNVTSSTIINIINHIQYINQNEEYEYQHYIELINSSIISLTIVPTQKDIFKPSSLAFVGVAIGIACIFAALLYLAISRISKLKQSSSSLKLDSNLQQVPPHKQPKYNIDSISIYMGGKIKNIDNF